MKCSNTACCCQCEGKFCQSCGSKMVPEVPASIFIICSGMPDGLPCGAEITQSQNFCTKCGTKVDKCQFDILQESCNKCGTVLSLDCMFCPDCGLKKGSLVTKDTSGANADAEITGGAEGESNNMGLVHAQESDNTLLSNKIKDDEAKHNPNADTSEDIDEAIEENPDMTQNDKTVESHPSEVDEHLRSDGESEMGDHKIISINLNFEELSDTTSEVSECQEREEKEQPTHKRKRRNGGGGTKAKSKKKREHKVKVHAEKFDLKKEQTTESENDFEKPDNVQKEEIIFVSDSVKTNKEHSDGKSETIPEDQTFVFGTKNSSSETCNTVAKSGNVVYPPDISVPSFFSATDIKRQSVQVAKDSQSLTSDTGPGSLNKVEGNNADNLSSPGSGNPQTNSNENLKTQADAKLSGENKTQKEEKNKTEKTQTKGGGQTSTSNQNNVSQSKQANENDKIAVTFHILVPTNTVEKNKNVLLIIGSAAYGGWDNRNLVLHTCRFDSAYTAMEITLKMAKNQLQSSIKYKYAVVKDQSKQTIEWENYYCHTNSDRYNNRRLYVHHRSLHNKVEWHQYDGVVTLKPTENFIQKGFNYIVGKHEKDFEGYAKDFTTRTCPAWFKSDFSVMDTTQTHQEAMDHLECLHNGLRKVCYVDSRAFNSEEEYTKKFAEWILLPLSRTLLHEDVASKGVCVRIIRALCIVVMCDKLKVPLLQEIWQNICKCLLVQADTANKTCVELKDILVYFPASKDLAKAVVSFIKKVNGFGKDPSWLYCIPLMHILEGICQPFEKPATHENHSDIVPKWWGIVEIGSVVQSFKRDGHTWQIPLTSMLKTLQPLFELDLYLPRSIVACLKPVELREIIGEEIIDVEVCCAAVYYLIKVAKQKYYQGSDITADERVYFPIELLKAIYNTRMMTEIECITKLKDRLQGYSLHEGSCPDQWWIAVMIAFESVQETVATNRSLNVLHGAQIFLLCVSIYQRICGQSENEEDKIELRQQFKHQELIETACSSVLTWLIKYGGDYWLAYLTRNLQFWNDAFLVQLKEEEVGIFWNERIANGLLDLLQRQDKYVTSELLRQYCRHRNDYCGLMQDCLNKFALAAVERGNDLDVFALDEEGKRGFASLLSEMFQREWKSVDESYINSRDERILKMALSWSPFRQFLKSLYNNEKCRSCLSKDCQSNLKITTDVLHEYAKSIETGDVKVGSLKYIQKNKNIFCEVVREIAQNNSRITKILSRVIDIRVNEVQAFELQADQMKTFLDLCSHFTDVCTDEIQLLLQKQVDIEKYPVSEFCKVEAVNEHTKEKQLLPDIRAFNVSDQVYEVLPHLEMYKRSLVFIKMWNERYSGVGQDCNTLDDIVRLVWFPVKESWKQFARRVDAGNVLFQEFEKMIGNTYRDDEQSILAELRRMNIPENCAAKRIEQLKQYRKLGSCVTGAKVILAFARRYNITGDFKAVLDIATYHNKDFKMNSFEPSLMKTCGILKEVSNKKAECLTAFLNCGNLIRWLKDTMHQLKELKVFVDLAFMSAGDEPMNQGKVQCLHSAVTGYAPLIFDLKPDTGYEDLLELCRIVWKELDANPNLPKMLIDTNRELEWLKDVEKAHGSVELTSFVQADAINTDGIYSVGRNVWPKDLSGRPSDTSGRSALLIEDILRLTVREQDGKRQKRDYTFTELQDLTSRLMLVAGKAEKGNDNVEEFVMTYDGVTRLCNVYIQLCAAGCVLFQDWSVRCFCDAKKPVSLILQFGHGQSVPSIKGRRSEQEELKDMVPELAKFMEKCLKEWLQHIKNRRKQYVHLNFFTIDQLVILQRELMKVGTDSQPSHLIYPLLSAVRQNCSPADVSEAMSAAKEKIDHQDTVDSNDVDDESGEGADHIGADVIQDEKRQLFIKELTNAGYDEVLAVRALEYVDLDDISQGIVWCMDHEDNLERDSQISSKKDVPVDEGSSYTSDFRGWSQSETSLQAMITTSVSKLTQQKDCGSGLLLKKLSVLWEQFLASITSNICDYLSLEHLGLILGYLADKNTVKIERILPATFSEGQPNLIVCPSALVKSDFTTYSAEVIVTALSVYMRDRDQPLPQSDEILMCTAATTKDEVDIFLRRAIFGTSKKIHCLVNADLLDYDVSEAAEKFLEEYLQEAHVYKDLKYRLVVICGSDNEFRSTIVSSLDKHKKQPIPVNASLLRQYIASKLNVQYENASEIKPAAFVDHERSSVRLIKSWRAGVGKTLFKQRQVEKLMCLNKTAKSVEISIPLHEKNIDMNYLIQRLLEHTLQPEEVTARLFHIDVSHEVENGVDYFLFNLLILGCMMDKTGFVWRKSPTDIYLIENMPLMIRATNRKDKQWLYVHSMLSILPDLTCRSPKESLNIFQGKRPYDYKQSDQLFDEKLFRSPVFQRPFKYLLRMERHSGLNDVQPYDVEGSPEMCLDLMLRHCGVTDPSWSEIHHFVWFLNTQLEAFEENNFASPAAAEHLPGFAQFLLRFLILMSRDFSTRSLNISEDSPGLKHHTEDKDQHMDADNVENFENQTELLQYQMRRTWESSPHPYLFFNSDRSTFTFLGFFIDRETGNLVDLQTGNVLEMGIMTKQLYKALAKNRAPLQEEFDRLPRAEKITKLCKVMGIDMEHDPDDTYELTTDNVKKMLAIYMRFRCDIPVIIMGETGCGKTRLIKFMCSLQMPPGLPTTNMILMKVHGGTKRQDIISKVEEAEKLAQENRKTYGQHMYTVLFFDEANTTEAIGLIKEIMCDRSMEGKKLTLCENLKMVAACNPYRKHARELIKKLEQAGLGYHVDADETTDRLGRVPMRRLVYRVQPLPHSLLPLVWDFGQLNIEVEDLYIRQMVKRYIRVDKLPDIPRLTEVVSAILTASQFYMREQKDECSFVSLRDVDRVLSVMSWFYEQSQGERILYNQMDGKLYGNQNQVANDEEEKPVAEKVGENVETNDRVDDLTRSLILAIGVCYHACLKKRKHYRQYIARYFGLPCRLPNGSGQIKAEIECCQDVFLDNVQLEKNIARNMALKENVFMMVVCIELRIPLFLVGKPGSSKSLAKTIVSDAMQGNSARKELFRDLKQAQMVSFQCSPLSTPNGIVGTFKQCAQFQKDKDLNTFVSIVVLDEVGLAEDSPRMPLKALHPLLEDGCQGDEIPEKYKKVAFIGISNWALDPAKMNRGILVQREVPDLTELKNSARGICRADQELGNLIKPFIEPMAKSYLELFESASEQMREFFGLRDFYSLVKMVFRFVEKAKRKPTWHEMQHAIKRNFGGLDQVDPVGSFKRNLAAVDFGESSGKPPDCSPAGLIDACLFDTYEMSSESRYLLLLTENYGALSIAQQQILSKSSRPIIIFGSSFRSDQEYTQVCRNINKIKICMETGNTVVLLNLENLYESLYDALNQYYVYFGGARYVDLGLGTHRVKCLVHETFRLIVVAEKQTVYKKFPIPLINRLEKHFLTTSTMLSTAQKELVKILDNWTKQFSAQRGLLFGQRGNKEGKMRVEDVFIGYHEDTCSSVILYICEKNQRIREHLEFETKVLEEAKSVLLWSATPDSLMRLKNSDLPNAEQTVLKDLYFEDQAHESLMHYLKWNIERLEPGKQLFSQITTHSKLLASPHRVHISKATGLHEEEILLLETLSSFDTEQQFSNKIRHHLQKVNKDMSLIVIQCDAGDINANLVACARYCVMDELEKMKEDLKAPAHVVFIVQLPRNATFSGFQCGVWHSAHIDDLFPEDTKMPAVQDMIGRSAATLIKEAIGKGAGNEYVKESLQSAVLAGEGERDVLPSFGQSEEYDSFESDDNASHRIDELKLDDVFFEMQVPETRQISEKRLNMKALILSCVQSALSVVKDKVENSGRETDRVTLLLKMLNQESDGEDENSFLHGICCLIVKLLEQKESETVTGMAQDWLTLEAANLDNINKTGTFRRCCVQILENKVSPIFAHIIAYLDTNENLDILDDVRSAWKHELWLALLHKPKALNLEYTALRNRNGSEVPVMTTGFEGHVFRARVPFSWLLIRNITEILQLKDPVNSENGDNVSRAESYLRVLSEQPFHIVLCSVIQAHHVEEVVNDYIHDFVHCVYNPGSDDEHQLVCQTVADAANQLSDKAVQTSVLLRLINAHLAQEELASRLTHFREMNRLCPDCSITILELKRKAPDHFMFKEQELILPAVCMLIEKLSPRKSELDQSEGRTNWLNRVHIFRPVVEKVLSLYGDEPYYSAYRLQTLRRARGLWSRVVVVKLFLEHVCNAERKDKITVKYCMPLWTTLGEETDIKEMKSFGKIERFLKSCNKGALKEYIGGEEICSQCERMLEGPPITLPCKDVLCEECYEDVKAFGSYECVKCHHVVPSGFKFEPQVVTRKTYDKLKDYQKRCNTFFMDVVSQLCFADNTAPAPEVVDRLLGYIFFQTSGKNQRTRDWTVFNTGIDPSPVFRSFILQLLIRTSKDSISTNLETYLRQARTMINDDPQDQDKHYIELSLLIIHCLEDMITEQANALNENEIDFVTKSLQRARQTIEVPQLNADKIYGIASARMGLAKAAKYVASVVMNGVRTVPANVRKVIEAAQILCEDTNVKWTRIYLVKYLCRCYGVDVYRTVCRSQAPFLRWIAIRDVNIEKVVEVSDRYIICGTPYMTIRDAVTKVVLGETVEHLAGTLQELQDVTRERVEALFTLAIHREVTSSYLYAQHQRKLTQEVQTSLIQFISDCQAVQNKLLATSLVQNELEPRRLRNVEGSAMFEQGIQCLIIHFMSVLTHFKGKRTLLYPLVTLMTRPQELTNCFLPTMPQDDLEDVKEALLAARNQVGSDQNPVFYRCPNGHPYVIGNCGRPAGTANCRECGSAIGGKGHRLSPGNTKDQGIDNTITGHILGRAEVRGRGPKPERSLTPVFCASLRLLVHMAMYVGAGNNQQGTRVLIKPDIEQNQVEQFLWSHIRLDVDDIHRALNLSADDVLLFMHTVVDHILKIHQEEEHVRDEVCQLLTKRGRKQWETTFCNKFVRDVLQNLDVVLKSCNQMIAKDQRLGADPLLCLLYETDAQVEKESSVMLQNIPRVWRYRTPISLQHLRKEVELKVADTKEHRILQHFLEEEHHLRALKYIPSVLRLHQALLSRFQKKLDKTDAASITVDSLIQENVAGPETEKLLQDFNCAWESVRNSLKMYLCPTKFGGRAVPKEYCNMSVSGNTALSMLLPTENEIGMCSYALLDFLIRKHNDFMDKYLKEIQRKQSDISTVLPREVTSADLISYDPQHDFLPLVLANCQYSFEMGKGTKIEYDFAGLERQLMDRFLFSKSVVDVGHVLQIDMMLYRTEITNAVVFKKLDEKIPQVVLNTADKIQICSDIRQLPDLCQSLDNLDIAIGFLQSTGGQPDKNLHDFMVKTLQMESSVLSIKAQQVCQFQHTKYLWLLLSLLKAKKMAESGQHSTSIFESVSLEFHDDVTEELAKAIRNYTKEMTVDNLGQFVELLHEFILLVVAVKQNTDDDDAMNTADNKLGDWLFGYVDSMDIPVFDVAVLGNFPSELLFRHSVKVWLSAYKMLRIKESNKLK